MNGELIFRNPRASAAPPASPIEPIRDRREATAHPSQEVDPSAGVAVLVIVHSLVIDRSPPRERPTAAERWIDVILGATAVVMIASLALVVVALIRCLSSF